MFDGIKKLFWSYEKKLQNAEEEYTYRNNLYENTAKWFYKSEFTSHQLLDYIKREHPNLLGYKSVNGETEDSEKYYDSRYVLDKNGNYFLKPGAYKRLPPYYLRTTKESALKAILADIKDIAHGNRYHWNKEIKYIKEKIEGPKYECY